MSTKTLHHQKVESPGYIFAADSSGLYLLSNFRGELRKTHHLCSRVRYGRSRSSKVVDFCSNPKGILDFLLVINLAPFLRYGELLVENRKLRFRQKQEAPTMATTGTRAAKPNFTQALSYCSELDRCVRDWTTRTTRHKHIVQRVIYPERRKSNTV